MVLGTAVLAGCTTADRVEFGEGFGAVMSDPDGRVVDFSGVTAGHEAGEESGFVLRLQNPEETSDGTAVGRWTGSYCFNLLNDVGLVESYPGGTFEVEPDDAVTENITVTLPDDLSPGAYLMSVTVPDFGAVGSAIFVDMGPSRGEIPDVWPSIPTSCS